jgi:hypothetical protein
LIGSRKSGTGRSLALAVIVSICIAVPVYRARRFASAAPRERTATSHIFSAHHYINYGLRFNFYGCSYNFSVDGSSHIGHSDCPREIVGALTRSPTATETPAELSATVYYDPANPSLNSLLDLSTASKSEYRQAAPWLCVEALIIFFFAAGRLLEATKKRRTGASGSGQQSSPRPGYE